MMEWEALHEPVIVVYPCLWERRKGRCLQKQAKNGGKAISFLSIPVKISPWISKSFFPISYPGHLPSNQMSVLVGQVLLPLWCNLEAC